MALIQAKKAFIKSEVPVGAIVFNKDGIISKAYNMVITKNDPLAHAEVIALKKATKKLKTTNLMHCSLYVTLEPCPICSYIISKFKLGNLYFGAYDSNNSNVFDKTKMLLNEKKFYIPKIYGGIAEEESKNLLDSFFKDVDDNI